MKTVLITGGSSGIGYEVSQYFARDGYQLLWVSKAEEELEKARHQFLQEQPSTKIHTLAIDLSRTNAPQSVFDWAKQNQWQIDVLINNAGFGTYGFTNEQSIEKEVTMIQLNVLGVYQLTRLFLKGMIERNAGTIINISSNSSFQPVARMNTYAATKAFVSHFSRGLQEELELQESKVRVMTVCPSAIQDTPFKLTAKMEKTKTFTGLTYTTQAEVGADIWKGFVKQKSFVVTGARMRLLHFFFPIIPYRLQQYLVRKETELG